MSGRIGRRAFLIAAGAALGGGLALGVVLSPGQRQRTLAPLVTGPDEHLLQAWLRIATDGTVTVLVPHAEMGQGVHTALAMLAAEELDADWSRVRVEQAPALAEYANHAQAQAWSLGAREIPFPLSEPLRGVYLRRAAAQQLQLTAGSSSVRITGQRVMRVAGAAAREMLLRAGALHLGVDAGELETSSGTVLHRASGRRAGYGELAQTAAGLDAPLDPKLKSPAAFRIVGTDVAPIAARERLDGSIRYAIDTVLPGMRYAAVRASPQFGGRLRRYDASRLDAAGGGEVVVALEDALAVVAGSYWSASRALAGIVTEFEPGASAGSSTASLYETMGAALDRLGRGEDGEVERTTGDADAVLASASRRITAEYRVPWLAHACLEPMNATVWLHDGRLEAWSGSQNPLRLRAQLAELAGMDPEAVHVHPVPLGGGFGRRIVHDCALQALRIALEAGSPLQLIWSREEDLRHDRYRPASLARGEAALGDDGLPLAWCLDYTGKSSQDAAPPIPYAIPHQRIRCARAALPVPTGAWRSVDHSQHGFFTECFVDELAHAAGRDPWQYRRALLAGEPRLLAVLDAAVAASGWETPLPRGQGRGLAVSACFGSYLAHVAEVEIDATGKPRVRRVVCAIDCGIAVHPDGVRAQIEGGILDGLSAALYGGIEIEDGAVRQGNFDDYRLLTIVDAPRIETLILNGGGPFGGVGEAGVPGIAPALANAVYAATGTRVRTLPFAHHTLRAAQDS